jgi:LysR family transcriptional regulator, glycine cleavage system transcriptional activator
MQTRRRDLPPLDLLRGFEAAARHLSFTKAAEELFLTQSAVSRQVQGLEEALGVPLFQRKHRALLLTDAGQLLQQTVARHLKELRETVAHITEEPVRMLTVTTLVTFASLWLIPRLAHFRRGHPGIDVRIAAANEILDLERDRVDIAIRYVGPERAPPGSLKLFGEEVVPMCAPALLKDKSRPLREPADLVHHVLLHDDPENSRYQAQYLQWDIWLQAMGLPDLEPAGSVRFSHYDQMIQAAVNGEGVALGRLPLMSQQIEKGTLVAPFEKSRARGRGTKSTRAYYVLTAPAAIARPEVKAFIDWLVEEAKQGIAPEAPPARAPAAGP